LRRPLRHLELPGRSLAGHGRVRRPAADGGRLPRATRIGARGPLHGAVSMKLYAGQGPVSVRSAPAITHALAQREASALNFALAVTGTRNAASRIGGLVPGSGRFSRSVASLAMRVRRLNAASAAVTASARAFTTASRAALRAARKAAPDVTRFAAVDSMADGWRVMRMPHSSQPEMRFMTQSS